MNRRHLPLTARFLRGAAAVAALTVVALLASCAAPTTSPAAGPGGAVPSQPNPPATPPPTPGPVVPAKPLVLELADTLADSSADSGDGDYLHITKITWARDSLSPLPPSQQPYEVRLDQLWRNPQGSKGRQLFAQWTGNGDCAPGDDSSWNSRKYIDNYAPRLTTDPKKTRAALVFDPGREKEKPVDVLYGIAGAYETDVLEKPVRAVMLRILADVPGLTAQTNVTDVIGRTGLLVSLKDIDSTNIPYRYDLLLHPQTGVVLSASGKIDGPMPTAFDPTFGANPAEHLASSYDSGRLYIENRYTPTADLPAIGCASPHAPYAAALAHQLAATAPAPSRSPASPPNGGVQA